MKKLLTLCLLGLTLISYAQEKEMEDKRAPGGFIFNAQMTTSGVGVSLNYLFGKPNLQWNLAIRGNSIRSNRENIIDSAYGDQGKKYVYGKMNYFFVLAPTVGIQHNAFPARKGNIMDVSVGINVGPSVGLTTPYYVEVFNPVPGNAFYGVREKAAYDPAIHAYNDIIGRAGLFNGEFDFNTSIGAHVRAYALLDFARAYKYVSGFEVGINADIYGDPIEIVASQERFENQSTFISATIGIIIGNRW
ncbi:MAG: hypothetical protein AAGC85_00780 [Bacteroidota bacterium]